MFMKALAFWRWLTQALPLLVMMLVLSFGLLSVRLSAHATSHSFLSPLTPYAGNFRVSPTPSAKILPHADSYMPRCGCLRFDRSLFALSTCRWRLSSSNTDQPFPRLSAQCAFGLTSIGLHSCVHAFRPPLSSCSRTPEVSCLQRRWQRLEDCLFQMHDLSFLSLYLFWLASGRTSVEESTVRIKHRFSKYFSSQRRPGNWVSEWFMCVQIGHRWFQTIGILFEISNLRCLPFVESLRTTGVNTIC